MMETVSGRQRESGLDARIDKIAITQLSLSLLLLLLLFFISIIFIIIFYCSYFYYYVKSITIFLLWLQLLLISISIKREIIIINRIIYIAWWFLWENGRRRRVVGRSVRRLGHMGMQSVVFGARVTNDVDGQREYIYKIYINIYMIMYVFLGRW